MRRVDLRGVLATGMVMAGCLAGLAQTSPPAAVPQAPVAATDAVTGGKLHGVVKSGNTPLPGVTVTAQNTLSGKRVATMTDTSGAWSLTLAQNGRYVVRTQFAGFAQGSQEARFSAAGSGQPGQEAANRDVVLNFDLMLASRAAAAEQQQEQQSTQAAQAIRQLATSGAQSLSLAGALSDGTENQAGTGGAAGAALPSIASSGDFGGDSVAINGQAGAVSPLAGVDVDRIRDAIETIRAQNGGDAGNFAGGGLFGGGGGFGGPGGFGGGGFGGGRGGGGGRGNFRGFNPGQPHGAIFWFGSNSALNAQTYSLTSVPQQQPVYGSNRFGLTFMSAPYLPGLTKPSGKDTVFLTLSGTRNSSPAGGYATVPTDAERTGNLAGLPALYNQTANYAPYLNNQIPVSPAAAQLLAYFPEPNLTGNSNGYNYRLVTTGQQNSTQAGLRYLRSLGANATQPGGGRGGGGGGRRSQSQGLRQSINFNYNWADSASDSVGLVPQLGGKSASHSNSLQAGYTVGYHRITNIFNLNWNRSAQQTTNYFTNTGNDIASSLGISLPDSNPLNYGLPNISMSNLSGLSQTQPSFSLSQTISASETLSWIHGKHNLRFGGDYRRVHRDFLGGSNATGNFTFSGKFTEDQAGDQTTGSSLADFLLGFPQETTINVTAGKSYLRDNVYDAYATDDWRIRPSLTFNIGLRYEFFAPYTEKYGRLAMVDTNPASGFTNQAEVQSGGVGASSGPLPEGLVFPFRTAFAPRLGLAWRVPKLKQMVVRAGYGMNYTVGQYGTFANTMARQPMVTDPAFVDEQTNIVSTLGALTLANGFYPAPSVGTNGSYSVDPHYRLPYVQAYNLDIQKTLPWGVVLNVGYNGSKGSRLDVRTAPRASVSSPGTDPTNLPFFYEQTAAFSRFNAGTVRVNKRLSGGISVGANYKYSHSIDDAGNGALGGSSSVVAQNWQNLQAEEGNSNLDQRHSVSGNYLYELPFGKDKFWVTSGVGSHILEGFSVSGTFTFATGTPLTPNYQAAVSDVARGTAGTLRPNRDFSQSITAGGGSQKMWFNTAAFVSPQGSAFGNASRNSIPGPGTISNNMSLSKTVSLHEQQSMEFRATANNVFNTVQYSGVSTSLDTPTYGQVTSAAAMRSFQFTARFRF
jgi:hypothetical protein